jgi:uncharacterized membrane protein YgcG
VSRRTLSLALLFAATLWLAGPAGAAERIVSFDSLVEIAPDGTLTVTETIAVEAEGKKIRRGIYRDFPTDYIGDLGTRVVVPFDVVSVRRNGATEPYHTKEIDGGTRVYMGREGAKIERGPHVYELTYTTRRQLGFFEDHDELYWNATGNFWAFPIERATATIRLPAGIAPEGIAHTCFTGAVGSKEKALRSFVDPDAGTVHFETTVELPPGHGLTVVALFPKGHVTPPSKEELQQALFDANRALFIGAGGAACVLAYYLLAWVVVGRDPTAGTIIPRFAPPQGMSPACMRHLMRMGYDDGCFATALVSMAVKGAVRIEDRRGEYTIVRTDADDAKLSPGEQRIAKKLLKTGRIKLKRSNHSRIGKAVKKFKSWLDLEHQGELFLANRMWVVPGVLISVGAVMFAGIGGATSNAFPLGFILLWLSVWTLGVAGFVRQIVQQWRSALRTPAGYQRSLAWISALFLTVFFLPFLGGEVMGMFFLAKIASYWMIPVLLVLIGLNVVFYTLLKRPTLAGRRLMDEIEGFKRYLETAEGDEIRHLKAPAPTPELFERYLPYAMALDVENAWSEHFTDVLAQASTDPSQGQSPHWYRSSHPGSFRISNFTRSLGPSLSSAVASSSTAPGSSSGGGGGGSSGGGGGGGGGGGW